MAMATSTMYKKCDCEEWVHSMTQLDGFIMLGLAHGAAYRGAPFVYCPWCGKKVRENPDYKSEQATQHQQVQYKSTS